jgi:hypothetical protein
MSYDYSSESRQLELPNPYRVQNAIMAWGAGLLILAGLVCLWWGREAWAQAHALSGAVPVAAALGLLTAGIWSAARVATRLRFFFGRKRPASLAPELAPGTFGGSEASRHLQDTLRQGALAYPEPQGPVEGLLYNLAPHLITAPLPLQALARKQFFNLAALVVTLLSFSVAWFMVNKAAARPWLAMGYFVFGFVFLLRPVVAQSTARVSVQSLVGLIAASVLAPVAIGLVAPVLPSWGAVSLAPQTTVMLLSGVAALVLVMLAVMAQVAPPPATRTSAQQSRLSMSAPPSALMDELERLFQSTWTERIPNRRYARAEPVIDPARHAAPFNGELMEETQPMPIGGSTASTLKAALDSPRHRWIAALDLYAATLTTIAVVLALIVVHSLSQHPQAFGDHIGQVGLSAILLLVAVFCQRAAEELWGRFDFESTLVWVEFAGTYQSSSIGTGNMVRSQVNTQNQVVRVENMTLRVWRTRIESVAFHKDGERQITAMFSTDQEAQELAAHLTEFAQAQSALLATASVQDQARLAALGLADRQLAQAAGVAGVLPATDAFLAPDLTLTDPLQAPQPASDAGLPPLPTVADDGGNAPQLTSFCHACGKPLLPQARFCSACGQAV